jgi:hypothetical protein
MVHRVDRVQSFLSSRPNLDSPTPSHFPKELEGNPSQIINDGQVIFLPSSKLFFCRSPSYFFMGLKNDTEEKRYPYPHCTSTRYRQAIQKEFSV